MSFHEALNMNFSLFLREKAVGNIKLSFVTSNHQTYKSDYLLIHL